EPAVLVAELGGGLALGVGLAVLILRLLAQLEDLDLEIAHFRLHAGHLVVRSAADGHQGGHGQGESQDACLHASSGMGIHSNQRLRAREKRRRAARRAFLGSRGLTWRRARWWCRTRR